MTEIDEAILHELWVEMAFAIDQGEADIAALFARRIVRFVTGKP